MSATGRQTGTARDACRADRTIPLNETGIEEAKITGEALKDVPFAAAFVSPLTRTRQTAELLIRDRHIPVYEDARIIEMCFGVYEGLSVVNPK